MADVAPTCERFAKKGGITIPCDGEEHPDQDGLFSCEVHDPVRFRIRGEAPYQPASAPRCWAPDGAWRCHRPAGHSGLHLSRDGDLVRGWAAGVAASSLIQAASGP